MMNVKDVEQFATELPRELMDAGRQVWLAGLGAAGMAGNTTQAVFGMLVDEGKRLYGEEKKLMDKVVQETGERMIAATKFVEENVQTTTKAALNRLGMPSRKDVAELTQRVEQLTAKVDALAMKKVAANAR